MATKKTGAKKTATKSAAKTGMKKATSKSARKTADKVPPGFERVEIATGPNMSGHVDQAAIAHGLSPAALATRAAAGEAAKPSAPAPSMVPRTAHADAVAATETTTGDAGKE